MNNEQEYLKEQCSIDINVRLCNYTKKEALKQFGEFPVHYLTICQKCGKAYGEYHHFLDCLIKKEGICNLCGKTSPNGEHLTCIDYEQALADQERG